jgi:hypothetical protein
LNPPAVAKKALGRDLAGLLSGARPARLVDSVASPQLPVLRNAAASPQETPESAESPRHSYPEGTTDATSRFGLQSLQSDAEPGTNRHRLAWCLGADVVLLALAIWLVVAMPVRNWIAYSLAALCVIFGGLVLGLTLFKGPLGLRMPKGRPAIPARPRVHVRLTRL